MAAAGQFVNEPVVCFSAGVEPHPGAETHCRFQTTQGFAVPFGVQTPRRFTQRLLRSVAAVDDEFASSRGSFVRREKQNAGRNLLGRADSSERVSIYQPLPYDLWTKCAANLVVQHWRCDLSRVDGVDPDAITVTSAMESGRLRQRTEFSLRSVVGGEKGIADDALDLRNVDDRPAAGTLHSLDRQFGAEERSGEVDVHDPPPVRK